MKKIISLFKRNYETDYLVRNEVVDGAEWVLRGEGVAKRKYDGTCFLIDNGRLYKRYEVKKGKKQPDNFIPASPVDPITGKQQGWLPVTDEPCDVYHREAFTSLENKLNGTYELIGEKVQGNAEKIVGHILIKHSEAEVYKDFPRTFDAIKTKLLEMDIEGVVFTHDDGRMVKIKKKDFVKR